MALRTAEVDTKSFMASLSKIEKVYSLEFLDSQLRLLAFEILAEAIKSPIPYDTGALLRSGTVEGGPGEVIFGFNKPYASIQDLGGTKLPPKGYGSEVGPIFYFSKTVERLGPKALEKLTRIIQAELEHSLRSQKK